MSDKDLATLAAWVDGGTPEGDPKDAPPPRQFVEGWQLGKPDLVLTVPEEMTIGASRPRPVPLFRAADEPGRGQVRHGHRGPAGQQPRPPPHAQFRRLNGKGRKLEQAERDRPKADDEQDHGPGYTVQMGVGFTPQGALGGWAPGQLAHKLPDGYG